ncbi:MAG: hypothetical protein IJW20_06235 [Clostridia bacterium]|nr:hypothetical protein [Clostridia bacterium]
MEEKVGKTSVSRPGDLSEGEIDATVKAILEDTDVQELLAKIGITKGQAYQDLSNKKFILPKKGEDEIGYAKRYIKFQVVAILMNKYNEKIHDDTTEEAREAWKKFALTHNTNMRRGDADAIIAMIENNYLLPSKDGKTAKKLTQKQKDIIVRKLREGVNSIDELLEEMEFEDEEPEIEEEPEQEVEGNLETMSGEELDENSTAIPELDDSEIEDNTVELEESVGDIELDEDNSQDLEEVEQTEELSEASSMEDYNFRLARDDEKRDALENNPEYGPEYESVTCYIPPVGATIESTAEIIMQVQKENPNQRITVSFNNILIDPQRFSSPTEIIEKFKEEVDKRRTDKGVIYQDTLDGLTTNTLNDPKKVSEVAPTVKGMEQTAQEKEIIPAPIAPAMDEQQQEDDEHQFPTMPEER